MFTLKNDRLYLEISELGAELRKLTVDGKDALWDANPEVWDGVAPLLFPICGGLRDDKYTFEGKEYSLDKHGFARKSVFSLEKQGHNYITLLLTDTPDTLKQYPWHFELRITYRLRETAVKVEYEVKNTDSKTMYFSIGAHEAYACPDGIENYDIIFPNNETLDACELDGNLIAHSSKRILTDSKYLPLYKSFFAIDALVFKNLRSRAATLRNRCTGKAVTVEFPNFDYFLLWTKPNGNYICLEPWCGIPSMCDDGYDITEKEGIISLEAGKTTLREHSIYF